MCLCFSRRGISILVMALQLLYAHARTEEDAILFLQTNGLLTRVAPNCPTCNRATTLIKKSANSDNRYWRCPTHKSFKVPLRRGSFFDRQSLPLRNIVELLLLWAFKEPVLNTTGLTGVSENTVIQWFSYFRDICSWWLLNNPYQIGGAGLTVEIAESLVAKRKNNVGRVVEQRWVFGGVCREAGQGFLVVVDNDRSAGRLLPLIQEHIAPGTTIHSDGWAAYNGIANLPVQPPYQHLVVNHSENFVDPQTGACTNTIECYWKNCKRRFKCMQGVHQRHLASHLDEFMWRELHGKSHQEALHHIIEHLAQWYPV